MSNSRRVKWRDRGDIHKEDSRAGLFEGHTSSGRVCNKGVSDLILHEAYKKIHNIWVVDLDRPSILSNDHQWYFNEWKLNKIPQWRRKHPTKEFLVGQTVSDPLTPLLPFNVVEYEH